MSGTAFAQAALDDAGKPQSTLSSTASPGTTETAEPQVEYGIDLRLRQVFVPKGLLELFMSRAAGGASNTGFGVDLVRRRGNLELQLGLEFEHLEVKEGVYIASGDNVGGNPPDEADYLISAKRAGSHFGWFTMEFTFLNHAEITKKLAVRYGGGAGLGILTGKVQKYDVPCSGATNDTVEPGCVPVGVTSPNGVVGTASAARGPNDYNLPPVFPVVNAIIGLQIRPTPKSVINIETGIRTLPFVGVSGGYFF